jgi:hypothetical protein
LPKPRGLYAYRVVVEKLHTFPGLVSKCRSVISFVINNNNNNILDLGEIGWDGMVWIEVAQDRKQWRALVDAVMNPVA